MSEGGEEGGHGETKWSVKLQTDIKFLGGKRKLRTEGIQVSYQYNSKFNNNYAVIASFPI